MTSGLIQLSSAQSCITFVPPFVWVYSRLSELNHTTSGYFICRVKEGEVNARSARSIEGAYRYLAIASLSQITPY
jgi:hypothetical protein